MAAISQTTFQVHLTGWKCLTCNSDFTGVYVFLNVQSTIYVSPGFKELNLNFQPYDECLNTKDIPSQPHRWWIFFWMNLTDSKIRLLVLNGIFTRGLLLCVCCVCLCVNFLLVHTITHHPFKLGSPNLDQKMQNFLLKAPVVLGAGWTKSSRWNLTSSQNPVYLHRFCAFEIFVRPSKTDENGVCSTS